MNNCNVCYQELKSPIFRAVSDQSLTSLCEARAGRVVVWSCNHCGHLCGDPLNDTESYYEADYRILLQNEEEDQIYEMDGERIIYRTDHQVNTLIDKLPMPTGSVVLDYGCAKASTPRRLLSQRPDLQMHLFDVSEMYRAYWEQFLSSERQAVHTTPSKWRENFDAITSFFALEHIPNPRDTLRHIASLLKEGGHFYAIVPDAFGNVADFVVIDHVNHFTPSSLTVLLELEGFNEISIDSQVHRGAHVVLARKGRGTPQVLNVELITQKSKEVAAYWGSISHRIQCFETEYPHGPVAIYGSGFYGAFIATTLTNPDRVRCFLDRSPFQQSKKLFGREVLAPENIPADIQILYIGLNPAIARKSIGPQSFPHLPNIKLVYL